MFTDENTGNEEKPVQVARRTFRLLFEDEYRDGFSTLRIAQVTRNAAGMPILNPRFIAPCLDLSSSTYLSGLMRRQIEILATKSGTLSGPRRQRGKITAEFSPSETANFWLLHTVNSYLPELKHIWKVRKGHPESAYVAMLRLAGALSTFSLEARPENLPDYDHDDLGRCFTLLDQAIRDLMETVIPSKFVSVSLEVKDRFIWGGTVTEDQYFRDSQFYLAVSAKMGVDDIIRKVPQLVKVSAQDDIQRLVRNALPGSAAPPRTGAARRHPHQARQPVFRAEPGRRPVERHDAIPPGRGPRARRNRGPQDGTADRARMTHLIMLESGPSGDASKEHPWRERRPRLRIVRIAIR